VYLTAYHMPFSRAGLRPGERVLVTAAGSGVGAAAIALARYAGARVFTTASTEAKRARAEASGAEAHAELDLIDLFTLERAAEAQELLASRAHFGRVLLAPTA
jgi:NADPH:quinone reductase-like Zn-dependent oxidoreductase